MQHFDVVVIGREIAGLVAGALLAKGGARVLHLDSDRARGTYKRDDLTLHRRFGLFGPWDATPAQKRVLFDLNLISDFSKRLVAFEPSLQLALPGQRLDVRREETALALELGREFPGSPEALSGILTRVAEANERLDKLLDGRVRLPPESWGDRRAAKKIFAEHPMPDVSDGFDEAALGHPLHRIASLCAPLMAGLSPEADVPARLLRAASRIAGGFFALAGGPDDIAEKLLGVITSTRGATRVDEIDDVDTKWLKGIVGLRLRSGESIGCEKLIGAELGQRLVERMPEKLFSKGWLRQVEALVPSHRIYTLNLGLRPEGVPEGMGPLGVRVGDPARPLVEDNLLFWWMSSSSKKLRGLTVAAIVPEADARDRVYWRALRERVLAALGELMPFHERHVAFVDVPWDDGHREDPRPATEMDPLYAWEGDSAFGLTALGYETPVKNLILANRQILPGLGLEGEFLAGLTAARLLRNPKDQPSWAET